MSTASTPAQPSRPEPPRPLPGTRGTTAPERLPGGRIGPDGLNFPWGPIQSWWHVDRYTVVEYLDDVSGRGNSDSAMHGRTLYAIYLDGKNLGYSATSLETAMVYGFEMARLGQPNLHVTRHFDAMTRKDDDQ